SCGPPLGTRITVESIGRPEKTIRFGVGSQLLFPFSTPQYHQHHCPAPRDRKKSLPTSSRQTSRPHWESPKIRGRKGLSPRRPAHNIATPSRITHDTIQARRALLFLRPRS